MFQKRPETSQNCSKNTNASPEDAPCLFPSTEACHLGRSRTASCIHRVFRRVASDHNTVDGIILQKLSDVLQYLRAPTKLQDSPTAPIQRGALGPENHAGVCAPCGGLFHRFRTASHIVFGMRLHTACSSLDAHWGSRGATG